MGLEIWDAIDMGCNVIARDDVLEGTIMSFLVASVLMTPAPSTATSFSLVACSSIPSAFALSFQYPGSFVSPA